MPFQVIIEDNFHSNDDEPERHRQGTYDTLDEAITACRQVIDRDLSDCYQPGMTADQLYVRYTSFGEDAFIVEIDASGPSEPSGPPMFSGWTYAKGRSAAITDGPPTIS